ncbi:hypothetical protein TEA_008180 [Camellia sinensis var. sinensis]|uniref:Protein kinase domain-containing protein n=1 Tax=Camellia sinensis var. sinensis TaxID=542762 RepID=A0A4S4ELI6_CAMSN|nr:hypothetical protein TEA_008180 [Camellia sinensis var. sinensis]
MGQCYGKTIPTSDNDASTTITADRPSQTPGRSSANNGAVKNTPARSSATSPWPSPYPHGGASPLPVGVSPSPARSTPRKFFKRPFPPPSPAQHIKASLARRFGYARPREGPIPEDVAAAEPDQSLDKNFGYNKNFGAKYELGKEVGRGHFGHTCQARGKKGDLRDLPLAVKIIAKAKLVSDLRVCNIMETMRRVEMHPYLTLETQMTTAISIEDVRREVKILKALSGHIHLVRFYDACEDANNVYIVMELCEGGELLDRILSRGGRYTEEDAKLIIVQILSVVAFCHLQGVVHRDLKPENFLFSSRNEDANMKLIDFGLSDFIRPDERLNDIVGSAYYVAPEVLHRSYSLEADIWSIGVITYILLCGSRPFWARTESGIFRSVLRADPNFDDLPWPYMSAEAKDFVKRLLNKDYRKRMTAAQALTHPWLRSENHPVPLDILIYKLVKSYLHASPFKCAALKPQPSLNLASATLLLPCLHFDRPSLSLSRLWLLSTRLGSGLTCFGYLFSVVKGAPRRAPRRKAQRGSTCAPELVPGEAPLICVVSSSLHLSTLIRLRLGLGGYDFDCDFNLQALSKALTVNELDFLRAQFLLLEPNKDGYISLDNFKMVIYFSFLLSLKLRCGLSFQGILALVRNATDAMNESRVPDILNAMAPLAYRKMEFEEFCAAAISTYQLEAVEGWEQIASTAFEHFEQEGNRVISVEELARELNVAPSAYSHIKDWIRSSDGKLSLLGYTKFLHGLTLRSSNTRQQ